MASEKRLALPLALVCWVMPCAAWGAPTAAEKDTARGMMDEGHAKRDAGDHQAALALFQGADAVMHVPVTGLEVAREQVALGQLVEARDSVQAVMRLPVQQDEPEVFRVARRDAAALDEDLVNRIPSLQIKVNAGATKVSIDGHPIPLAALVAPFKVNPGHHVVVATAEGGETAKEVDVREAEIASVDLDVARAENSEPPHLDVETTASVGKPTSTSSAVPWLRWGGLGLAAVGLSAGTITGLMALSFKSAADKGCVNDMCPPSTWSNVDSARTTSTLATIAFSAAGAGAALAVASFVIPPARAAAAPTGAGGIYVEPWLGPASAGVRGAF